MFLIVCLSLQRLLDAGADAADGAGDRERRGPPAHGGGELPGQGGPRPLRPQVEERAGEGRPGLLRRRPGPGAERRPPRPRHAPAPRRPHRHQALHGARGPRPLPRLLPPPPLPARRHVLARPRPLGAPQQHHLHTTPHR